MLSFGCLVASSIEGSLGSMQYELLANLEISAVSPLNFCTMAALISLAVDVSVTVIVPSGVGVLQPSSWSNVMTVRVLVSSCSDWLLVVVCGCGGCVWLLLLVDVAGCVPPKVW